MNLLTPIAGFLIGYGGIMGYQVIDSTYKGEMPGPKSFGYFIGGMTLLSAATIYALGRTDKVFNAEGNYNDFIEDMEGVIGKYGEMKDFDSGYNPQDNLLKARMVVEVDDDDFDNVEFDAEMMMPEKQCVICGGPYIGYGHNPEPIFPMSRGRCCDVCNATVVIPYRLGGMNFRFGEDFESETTRKFRNRFDIKERGNPRSRAATGVKRGVWKNFFRKDAEGMSDELARVRTMSGKPVSETLRKLKQDKNLSAKDARTRKEIKAEYNDVKSVRLEKSNTDSYFTDDQPEYPTGNWVVEGENIYLITTYRPHPVGSNGAMDKLEPKRVVINARGEGLTEELAYEDYSNKARESGKSQRWIAGAEGINKKGISWIDTEDDEGLKQDWDDETNIIENHLSSQGYNKCGSGKFFSDRTYAWVLHRFRRYIQDLPDKIKGYRGVVEDREYLEYFRDDQFVFSPWENKSKNKVALVWQFYDHHGFLVSEPYYKYFSLTTPPSWYHNKFELHIGEDYRYDACPICDYNNPMTTQSDARKLAAHIYSHGPIINGSPFNDFYIDIEPQYSNDASANFGWGNPMWGPDVEIIASQLPYLYGFNFAEYWSPTKSQQARYRKKANAIKAGLRAAGFKPKR